MVMRRNQNSQPKHVPTGFQDAPLPQISYDVQMVRK